MYIYISKLGMKIFTSSRNIYNLIKVISNIIFYYLIFINPSLPLPERSPRLIKSSFILLRHGIFHLYYYIIRTFKSCISLYQFYIFIITLYHSDVYYYTDRIK